LQKIKVDTSIQTRHLNAKIKNKESGISNGSKAATKEKPHSTTKIPKIR
jgi:hypothetical protein